MPPRAVPLPFLPLPGAMVHAISTALPSTGVPVGNAITASTPASSAHATEQKATSEDLPLWVETKTTEGKVS